MTFGYGIRYAPLMLGGASAERTLLVLLGFTVAASAHAESQTSSQPQDPQAAGSQPQTQRQQTAILWYRSTEGCPSGPDFLVRLGDRSRSVRLAQAGDRVDFVVNLAQGSDGARGQLERETGRGTVAIREVADASCERVAEVLALNLALALDPEAMASEIPAEPAALEQTEDARKEQTISAQPPSHNEPRVLPVAKQAQGDSTHPPDQEERPSVGLRLGMQGGILTGVAARGMGRGTAFFEVSRIIERDEPYLVIIFNGQYAMR